MGLVIVMMIGYEARLGAFDFVVMGQGLENALSRLGVVFEVAKGLKKLVWHVLPLERLHTVGVEQKAADVYLAATALALIKLRAVHAPQLAAIKVIADLLLRDDTPQRIHDLTRRQPFLGWDVKANRHLRIRVLVGRRHWFSVGYFLKNSDWLSPIAVK